MSYDAPEPYTAEISRNNPTCFLFLVDQSGSMGRIFSGQSDRTLAQGVADAINRLLRDLVRACSNGEIIFDRYAIGVIGYGEEVSLVNWLILGTHDLIHGKISGSQYKY